MKDLNKLHYFEVPTVMKHGIGAVKHLADEAAALGITKPLVVTDAGVIKAGILDKVVAPLEAAGIKYVLYDRVVYNPPLDVVAAGTRMYMDSNCDGLIAVGGGSPMDAAKAIGVEVVHGESVLAYECAEGKKPLSKRIPPLICIPTTAGTGSEVTLWAVITDPAREFKFNCGGPLIAAHLALIDPELHVTMPPQVTAGTGMDALCHAIECYTCHYAQPQTDAVALLAIEYCGQYLRRAVADGTDIEARYYMAMASMLAGLSYGAESAGAVHAMTQTMGGMYPVHHGLAVAATLGPVMEYNWMGCMQKYKKVAIALGEDVTGMSDRDAALQAAVAVNKLTRDIEIPTLQEQGVDPNDLERLAAAAFADPQTVGNPRYLTLDSYRWMYKRAFGLL